jgi:hypothetical protein
MANTWKRVMLPALVATMQPNARAWEREVDDGVLRVLRTVERDDDASPWRTHISISHSRVDEQGHRSPGRYPTWDEQKEAVWTFAPGKPMASFLPPQGEPYVNVHETTFHWWETTRDQLRNIR